MQNPNAVFVFQVGGALTTAASSHVVLINGAQASRVFWQVNGGADIGATGDFAGTLIALGAVGVGHGSLVNGRVFARDGALTLDDNQFYSVPPVVAITGGASATTTDTTPPISGTTDVEAPGLVTVTINGQTLTATPSGGTWSVTPAILANATYPVVASVSDGAGNPGSATQQLTVDTVPPVVTLDGGPSVTTNDPTPTIAGTSDVAPGTIVRVTVAGQIRTALVQPDWSWNVTPAPLADGPVTVTASVTDPAGNPGTATQTLTVDTSAPALTITGGANRLTNDATPDISGTAAVPPGTIVTATLADETLDGIVQGDGTWSVTASGLADGPHRVVVTVADAAGNQARSTQALTVDTVSPLVAITGGATATTSDAEPTITGTSDAAPGTLVTVSIAGQEMTTLVQANHTWNATPAPVGEGTWSVGASALDPAGNRGSAGQVLTIAAEVPPPTGGSGPGVPAPPPSATPGPGVPTPAPPSRPDPGVPTPTTPAPGGAGTADVAAAAAVTGAPNQRITGSPFAIAAKVAAPRGGRVVVTATGTVTIKGVGKGIALARLKVTVAAGHATTLKLRLAGTRKVAAAALTRIRAALRTRKAVTATITLKLVDAAGHTRTATRRVRLT